MAKLSSLLKYEAPKDNRMRKCCFRASHDTQAPPSDLCAVLTYSKDFEVEKY